jgi:ankyrin repeat protein
LIESHKTFAVSSTSIVLSIPAVGKHQDVPLPPLCQSSTWTGQNGLRAVRLAGADPNAVDKSGVAPLHRAVRNRCAAAVKALIDGGADPRAPNRNGSTPMLLATQNTGRGGSGSTEAKLQQESILRLLDEHAAT